MQRKRGEIDPAVEDPEQRDRPAPPPINHQRSASPPEQQIPTIGSAGGLAGHSTGSRRAGIGSGRSPLNR